MVFTYLLMPSNSDDGRYFGAILLKIDEFFNKVEVVTSTERTVAV